MCKHSLYLRHRILCYLQCKKHMRARPEFCQISICRQQVYAQFNLYDVKNVLLRQQKTNGGTVQFNVSGLSNDIYYLHIYDGESSSPEIHQIMVEK